MKKWIAMLLTAAMLVSVLAGCGKKEATEDFKASVDAIAEVYLALDEQAEMYAQALSSAEAYLDGKISQETAMERLQEIYLWFQQETEAQKAPEADAELVEKFENCGVSLQDYQAFSEELAYSLNDFLFRTGNLIEYLSYTENFGNAWVHLEDSCRNGRKLQKAMAGYYYYAGINSWFLQPNEGEMAYLQDALIDKVTCYIPEKAEYHRTMEAVQEAVDRYLDDVETLNREMEEKTGQYENELLEMYQVYGKISDLMDRLDAWDDIGEQRMSILNRTIEMAEELTDALFEGDMEKIRELDQELDELIAMIEALQKN